jgi:hypothetical protein
MNPLERQAVREILAEVRQEMDAIFGQSQTSISMDEDRLAEVVHDVAARWLRARAPTPTCRWYPIPCGSRTRL